MWVFTYLDNLLVRQTEYISHSLVGYLSFYNVQSLSQCWVVLASLLPALISQCNGITQRSISEGEGRGVRNSTWDVGYAVVYNALLGINGLAMRGGV